MKPGSLVIDGRFRVLRHIGGGGTSEVYLAEQVSLGRKVALKVLRRDMGGREDLSERFRREAKILSSVEHPGVVRVIDFDQTPGSSCLVLELAEGETLESALSNGPVTLERGLTLLAQLAEGLAAIHDKGIVHRDLKPHNIVLSQTPRGEQARLLDFGIAKLVMSDQQDPSVSQPGLVIGTPAYLAPEQASGKPLDTRTDVYSFGVVAYQLLTGKLPLAGPTARDFLVQHAHTAPTPITEAAAYLTEQPELVHLIMRCLEKDPERRPAHGRALVEELSRLPALTAAQASTVPADPNLTVRARLGPHRTDPMGQPVVAEPLAATEPAVPIVVPSAPPARAALVSSSFLAVGRALSHFGRVTVDVLARRGVGNTVLAVILLTTIALVVYSLLPKPLNVRARLLLERGQPYEALELVEGGLAEATPQEAPELRALKATALHHLKRHSEERSVLEANDRDAIRTGLRPLLVALAEEFAKAEDDPALNELLSLAPASELESTYTDLARGPLSLAQWGALRYLDVTGSAEGLNRVRLYSDALSFYDCEARITAVHRLVELADADALDALRRLSETPKATWASGDTKNCGQDEASEAVRELKRILAEKRP